MTFNRLIFTIAIVTLLAIALYLPIAFESLREASPVESTRQAAAIPATTEPGLPAATPDPAPVAQAVPQALEQLTGSRQLEIFGRVLDAESQPIKDVLITEERYFFNTHSDTLGNYRIVLNLPRHRYPTLQFLRNGFEGRRISLTRDQLGQRARYELDVVLEENPDTVLLAGWVGNDIGASLEGARVELSSLESNSEENYYLTVFSNASGRFALTGVPANRRYRLTVNLASEYATYRDPDFFVSSNPRQLDIELESLKFVDIDGMILNRESAPVSSFEIDISNVTTGGHSAKITSDSSGYFSLRNFPLGEIYLSTRGSEIHRITGLVLTDADHRNLVLTIDRGNHYLSGWVSDQSGIVPESAMVTLEKIIRDGPVEYYQYHSQATDETGKFLFQDLGGGEYRVTVYAQGYHNHASLHRFTNQADEIWIRLKPVKK